MTKIAIVGAGAAGCFASIELKRLMPSCSVSVFEAQDRPLKKVAVTGGGRCNLTNSFEGIGRMAEVYPRGDKLMQRAFHTFSNMDTMVWFEGHGVRLVTQNDRCVFPKSQDAHEIVSTLISLMRSSGVKLSCNRKITDIRPLMEEYDAVLLTSGGAAVSMLEGVDIFIEPLVPSLFSFRLPDDPIKSLTGTVVENCIASIPGTSFKAQGPLLVTDWGMSGPSILKLSSYAARYLAEKGYACPLSVNWTGLSRPDEVASFLKGFLEENGKKMLSSVHPSFLTSRLWQYLVGKLSFREDIRCNEIGSKGFNRLCTVLYEDQYDIKGKNKFKEEFVTCGGVSLKEINLSTMESRKYPGLFFAGEVLDIDAITGGFNLQAAWTTAIVAAKGIEQMKENI